MTVYVDIKPEMIEWAIERSGKSKDDFKKELKWFSDKKKPTFKQLQEFAKKTFIPFGYLFLESPFEETLPIVDYRTLLDRQKKKISANLRDTIYSMQNRQEFIRDYLINEGYNQFSFFDPCLINLSPAVVAERIKNNLNLKKDWISECKNSDDVFKKLRNTLEDFNVFVFTGSYVGSNTNRSLDINEFRGFTLNDEYAPVIFINTNDSKAAKLFTLVHEVVHVWTGTYGITGNSYLEENVNNTTENFCNKVAGEFLVPEEIFLQSWEKYQNDTERIRKLANIFKVSELVIAKRGYDCKVITYCNYKSIFEQTQTKWNFRKEQSKEEGKTKGGDYYNTIKMNVGHRFFQMISESIGNGSLLFTDAYSLTNTSSKTLHKIISGE